jgi:CDP-diacylglycerol--serine O-phosphatidyltransferase
VPLVIAAYVLVAAGLLVSTLPTYSGKLAGERIAREYVKPALAGAALAVALLLTYPFATLAAVTLAYLALIPLGVSRFEARRRAWDAGAAAGRPYADELSGRDEEDGPVPPTETRH